MSELRNPAVRTRSRGEVAVMAVYASITAYIAADQLLSMFLPSTLIRIFELVCLGVMVWYTVKIWTYGETPRYRGWPLVLILLLAACNLFIIIRGNYGGGLKDMVLLKFSYLQIPAYILPFAILLLPNRKYINAILEVLFFSMLLVIPIWLLHLLDLVRDSFYGEALGVYLPFFGALLILFRKKLNMRRQLVVFAIYGFYFILMLLNARRNMVVSLSLFFVVAFIMGNVTRFKTDMRSRLLLLGAVAGAVALIIANWGVLSSTVFDRILYRGLEDTRSGVELTFLSDMASSPVQDWIWGRGLDGAYENMKQDPVTLEFNYDRSVIETGYLYLLLKGGLMYVLLILSFLFTAFFRGISFKKPLLTGMALFLLIYLLDMYMTNPVSFFAVKTVIFWLIVSICLQYREKVVRK